MRIFIAINFDETVKSQIVQVQDGLREHSLKGNFTLRENLHLTLVFLGELPENKIDSIKKIISSIKFEPFQITFTHTGYFEQHLGKLFWIGIKQSNELLHIQKKLVDLLLESNFIIENRKFVPHLTLSRKTSIKSFFKEQNLDIKAIVGKISLMKSERVDGVLVYTEI